MPVYVDPLVPTVKSKKWPYDKGCHLLADSEKELLDFAGRIGLSLDWYQKKSTLPHFDLTPGKRMRAIKAGAIEIGVLAVKNMIDTARELARQRDLERKEQVEQFLKARSRKI